MPTGGTPEPRATRQRLAAELRRLREMAGFSGREMAVRISVSQSKVSRIESAATMPSAPAVDAWLDAVGADEDTRAKLAALTEAAFTEVQAWRIALSTHGQLQTEIGRREALAQRIRMFQPSMIPGLLQTAEYARRVFGLFHIPYHDEELSKAVAARLDRQLALYDEDRSFEFLITEAALRWRPGPPRVLVAQLDRISSLMTLDNLTIGLVPCDTEATTEIPTGFEILTEADGDQMVTIDTLHANLVITEPSSVADYERAWSALREMALRDRAAHDFLDSVARSINASAE